jgi:RNA polymerase sigma factor (sigma-70 family)
MRASVSDFGFGRPVSTHAAGSDDLLADDPRESRLWAYAVSIGAPPDDAADAVQDAFLRLSQAQLEGQTVENPVAWLFTTVHHLVVDEARRRSAFVRAISRLAGLRDSRLAAVPPGEPTDEVWSAVDLLPVRQRAAIYLRYRADLDYASIANVLVVTESAARSYVAKGLKQLERLLSSRRNDL